MNGLYLVFIDPFMQMGEAPFFFAEVVIGGLMSGVMYSLVALGFVLIFKASGVFNFAQGVLALFAALFSAGCAESPPESTTEAFAVPGLSLDIDGRPEHAGQPSLVVETDDVTVEIDLSAR